DLGGCRLEEVEATDRKVFGIDGVEAAGDLDHGAVSKVMGEQAAVNGGQHQNHLDIVFSSVEQALECAQQKVTRQVTLVDRVQDDDVVVGQQRIVDHVPQQKAFGEKQHFGVFRLLSLEPNLVTWQLNSTTEGQ